MRPADPIEFWHSKALVLGNFVGPVEGKQSLVARTAAGERVIIDAGQIVGLWTACEVRGDLPASPNHWEQLLIEARELLQSMPTRSLDLGPFWRAASSREKGFVVTPGHAAEFLFAENDGKRGLRKRRHFLFNT